MKEFKPGQLIQEILEESKDGVLEPQQVKDLRLEVAHVILYDASFKDRVLKDTIDYIEKNYPEITLWEENEGIIPTEDAFTEEIFEEQRQLLKKNFSRERVDWLEKAGKILYGKPAAKTTSGEKGQGEQETAKKYQRQQTANTQNRQSAAQKTQKKWPILLIVGTVIMLLIGMFVSIFQK